MTHTDMAPSADGNFSLERDAGVVTIGAGCSIPETHLRTILPTDIHAIQLIKAQIQDQKIPYYYVPGCEYKILTVAELNALNKKGKLAFQAKKYQS